MEYLSSSNNPDDKIFNELIRENWNGDAPFEVSPDAGIRRVLRDAIELERRLNSGEAGVTRSDICEALEALNCDWESIGAHELTQKITSKLYPFDSMWILTHSELAAISGVVAGLEYGGEDALGAFCNAAHAEMKIIDFDIKDLDFKDGGIYHKVFARCVPAESVWEEDLNDMESDEDGDALEKAFILSAPVDMVECIDPEHPTIEGCHEFLEEYYPNISARIAEAPDATLNPQEIIHWLQSFTFTIDPERLPEEFTEEEMVRFIEYCVEDTLKFDTFAYDVHVDGDIYAFAVSREIDDTPRRHKQTTHWKQPLHDITITGVISEPTSEYDKEGFSVYHLQLATKLFVPEHRGGYIFVQIPPDSLRDIVSRRPDKSDFPFSSDAIVNEPTYEEETDFEIVEDETEDDDIGYEEDDVDEYEQQLRYLEAFSILREQVATTITDLESRQFDSYDQAQHERQQLDLLLGDFVDEWHDFNFQVLLSGEGLVLPDIQIDQEITESKNIITFTRGEYDTVTNHPFLTAEGSLAGNQTFCIYNEATKRYKFQAYLEFFMPDDSKGSFVHKDWMTNSPLVEVNTTKHCLVDLSRPIDMTTAEIKRDEERLAIMQEAQAYVEQHTLDARVLTELKNLSEFTEGIFESGLDYPTLMTLRHAAHISRGTPEGLQFLAKAIETLLGPGRSISFAGKYYRPDQMVDDDDIQNVRVVGVVSKHMFLEEDQIALVVANSREDVIKDKCGLVPLETLEFLIL